MGWLAIISALLPLIMKILELFQKVDPATLTKKQREKFGQLRTACQNFEAMAQSKGVSAVPMPMQSAEEE